MEFNVFSVLALVGGLALFLYGMNVMSSSLEKMAGGKLEGLLKRMTANPFVSMLLGTVITAVIQSSSATTVMLVGLVNSGILAFSQAIYVCFGASIGTTVTAWILSLMGIESSGFWIQMLKPVNFSPILAIIGIFMLMLCKKDRNRTVGTVMVAFAVLMYGMAMMSDAVEPLAEMPEFANVLVHFKNPFLALLVAMVFTAVIQSSSAATGILQALALTGGFTYEMVIPMIMGINIGTCITAMLSSIGTGLHARRLAVSYLLMKVINSMICLPAFLILNSIFRWEFVQSTIDPVGIAVLHTAFSLVLTVLLMPFTKQLIKLSELIVRDKKKASAQKEDDTFCMLDDRLLQSPSVAIAECNNLTVQMSALAYETLIRTISVLYKYDEATGERILKQEEKLDLMEDRLGTYLVKLSSQALSTQDSHAVSRMLHSIGDFERLGDHSVNLLKVSQEMHEKSITFSEQAMKELAVLTDATVEILTLTTNAFRENSVSLAGQVEPLEQVIDKLIAQIKDNHIKRLRNGNCTIEMGFVLSDLLNNYERISDHCSNIAVTVIEVEQNSYDTHRYLNAIKNGNSDFNRAFAEFDQKYAI